MLLPGSSPDIILLFAGAGLVLYAASRAAVDALTETSNPRPARMALGHWVPIACAALLATAAGRSEIGIGLAFATSVAALALNLGILITLVPPLEEPPPSARGWLLLLPATLLPLLAGFSASLNWIHAVMLLALGSAIAAVWSSPSADEVPFAAEANVRKVRIVQLILAIGLAVVGGWLGYQAIMAADAKTKVATSGLIAAAILAPLLSLPMLGTGAIAGNNGRFGSVVASMIALVLLNLTLLLPLVVFTHYIRQALVTWRAGTHELAELVEQLRPVPFPLGVWRIDNVLLIVLAMMLIPVSLGRWKLQRTDGIGLALGYAAYLIASAALTIRL